MITATYPIRARRHAGWTDSFLLERENPPIPPATDPTYTPVDLTGYTARLQVREHGDRVVPPPDLAAPVGRTADGDGWCAVRPRGAIARLTFGAGHGGITDR